MNVDKYIKSCLFASISWSKKYKFYAQNMILTPTHPLFDELRSLYYKELIKKQFQKRILNGISSTKGAVTILLSRWLIFRFLKYILWILA